MSFETESLLADSAEITTSLLKCKCSQAKTDPETSERLRNMSSFYLVKIRHYETGKSFSVLFIYLPYEWCLHEHLVDGATL